MAALANKRTFKRDMKLLFRYITAPLVVIYGIVSYPFYKHRKLTINELNTIAIMEELIQIIQTEEDLIQYFEIYEIEGANIQSNTVQVQNQLTAVAQ